MKIPVANKRTEHSLRREFLIMTIQVYNSLFCKTGDGLVADAACNADMSVIFKWAKPGQSIPPPFYSILKSLTGNFLRDL